MSMTVTNIDVSSVILADAYFDDETWAAAGADELAEGTIMGRVTASGKIVPYASGASDGSETPIGVLTAVYSASGAGDVAVRMMVSGKVRAGKLVIDAGGSVTKPLLDQLRNVSIVGLEVEELNIQDNQ